MVTQTLQVNIWISIPMLSCVAFPFDFDPKDGRHFVMTDPLSISVGAITLLGAGAKAVELSHALHSSYRNAGKEMLHGRTQHVILHENVQLARAITEDSRHFQISASQASLERIQDEFPSGLRLEKKRDKLLWALKHRGKVGELLSRMKEIDISTSLALQLQAA
jgi:hypothetical protein